MEHKPLPMLANIGADVIFKKDDKILLLQRSATNKNPGQYTFVGGKSDAGESITDTAIREAFEEVGVRIQPKDLQFIHVIQKIMPRNAHNKDWFFFIFVVDTWQGELYNKEPQKHSQMAWFSLNDLPKGLGETHRQAIIQWQNKQYCSVFKLNS